MNSAKEFWDGMTANVAAEYLQAAPKIASKWNISNYGYERVDIYSGITVCDVGELGEKFQWSVWCPWLSAMGPEKCGKAKSIKLAQRYCDRTIKKLGWILT